MPTIETEQTVKVEVEFEVFCNTCGCGLCGETTIKGHTYPQLRVNICPDCKKEYDELIRDLSKERNELQEKLDQKTDECESLIREIHKLQKEIQ